MFGSALQLCAEYARVMTNACIGRAIVKAEAEEATDLNEDHLRKVLLQALLDFR